MNDSFSRTFSELNLLFELKIRFVSFADFRRIFALFLDCKMLRVEGDKRKRKISAKKLRNNVLVDSDSDDLEEISSSEEKEKQVFFLSTFSVVFLKKNRKKSKKKKKHNQKNRFRLLIECCEMELCGAIWTAIG